MIRLSVPLQILFEAYKDCEDNRSNNATQSTDDTPGTPVYSTASDSQELFPLPLRDRVVHGPAIFAAHSIVDTCLKHCCELPNKSNNNNLW